MYDKLAFAVGILLESHQLAEAIQLGYKLSEISDLASLSLNLHLEYMIISHLNTYYFIPTAITTINQDLNSFKCMIN